MKKVFISIGVELIVLVIVAATVISLISLKKNKEGLFDATQQTTEETQEFVETANATLTAEDHKPQRQVVEMNGQEYVISSVNKIDAFPIVLDTTKADYRGKNELSGYLICDGSNYLDIKLDSTNDDYLSYIKIEDIDTYNGKCFVIKSVSETRLNKKKIITTGQVYLHKYVQDSNYFEDIDNDGIEENIPAVIDYVTPVDSIIFWE